MNSRLWKNFSANITVFTVLLCFSNIFGQQSTQSSPISEDEDVVKISTALVQMDVTVTDRKGNIIKDLKPEEIEIYENQKKQNITNFSFIESENTALDKTKIDNSQTSAASTLKAPAMINPANVRRTIAFVVDDLTLESEGIYYTQKALKNFVENQMQEGDLVSIICTSGTVGALQQFTSDKRQLYAAIKNIRWRSFGKQATGNFALFSSNSEVPFSTGEDVKTGAEDEYESYQQSVLTVGALGTAGYLINGMKKLPGRKSVMFISNVLSLIRADTRLPDDKVLKALKGLIESANRASIVIYTMMARGLPSGGRLFSAADASSGIRRGSEIETAQGLAEERNKNFLDDLEKQAGLNRLALETGGLSLVNLNTLGANIRRMLDDQKGYYLIGYQPDAETFDPAVLRFNSFTVKVNRPGTVVRYRSGFFGVNDKKEDLEKNLSINEQFNEILSSPFARNDIGVYLAAVFENSRRGSYVRSFLYIQSKDLTFTDEPGGGKKATFDVVARASSEAGEPLVQSAQQQTVRLNAEQYQKALSTGIIYTFNVAINKPGAYQMRIAVRDSSNGKAGSASNFVSVPNLEKKRLTLSGITLGSFTTEEWAEIQNSDKSIETEKAKSNTAFRRYKSGSVLGFKYTIFNARMDKQSKKPNLQAQIRLFREGKVFFEGTVKPVEIAGIKDYARINVNNAISLGKEMPPGEYLLQIEVNDTTFNSEKALASQTIDFEVVS